MQPSQTKSRDIKSRPLSTMPDFTHGLYHSNTVNKSPAAVHEFAKDEANIRLILADFPKDFQNFLDLKFVDSKNSSEQLYTLSYANNEKAKIQGTLTLELEQGPAGRGTVVTAFAKFGSYSSKDEGPSDVINVFLKRFKALIETGVLATTKGQPNGEDEASTRTTKH